MVNRDIVNIENWINMHGMQLNPPKTQAIIIGSKFNIDRINFSLIPKICINNYSVEYSSKVKNLGFIMNQYLTGTDYISSIIGKVYGVLARLRHVRTSVPNYAKIDIVKGIIYPIFNYCSILYHGYGIHGTLEDERRLQVAQNSCIRFILNINRWSHISEHRNRLGFLTAFNSRIVDVCCFIYRANSCQTPEYVRCLFNKNNNNTRSNGSLVPSKVKTERDKLSISHSGSILWNSLPEAILSSPSIAVFRSRLHSFLFNQQTST
jgi:hypothetical protein